MILTCRLSGTSALEVPWRLPSYIATSPAAKIRKVRTTKTTPPSHRARQMGPPPKATAAVTVASVAANLPKI